jgi:hypothetical protein
MSKRRFIFFKRWKYTVIYYGLKSSVFVQVDGLLTTGRSGCDFLEKIYGKVPNALNKTFL